MTRPARTPAATRRIAISGVLFAALSLLNEQFVSHHSWAASIILAVIVALAWTVAMVVVDAYRRGRGKSTLFPDGSYRDNIRRNWAADRYPPLGWLGCALVFGTFAALGVFVLITGSVAAGAICIVVLGSMFVVCVVQAVRSRRRSHVAH